MSENVTKGADEKFCESCGAVIKIAAEICPKCGVRQKVATATADPNAVSEKNINTTLLLCTFLGWLGVHRFYTGKVGTGILIIILSLFGVGFIWVLIDLITILAGNFKDKEGKRVLN